MRRLSTTVPVEPETLERLKGYKVGGDSYDDVLRALMDEVPVEDHLSRRLHVGRRGAQVDWDALRDAVRRR